MSPPATGNRHGPCRKAAAPPAPSSGERRPPGQGWPLGLAAAIVTALVTWIWSGTDQTPPSAAPAGEVIPPGSTPMAEQAMPLPPPVANPHAPRAMEVCGLGHVPLPAGVPGAGSAGGLEALPTPLGNASLAQARERLLAGLHQSDWTRARVAAQWLDRPDTEDPIIWHAWAQATLQQAMAQPDAVALSWAEEACGRLLGAGDGGQGSACRRELIHAQLRLEPDNARHWAALAEEDLAAADDAWQGLLRARRWHEVPQAMVLVTQQALPRDIPSYLRLALGTEVGTRAFALPSPGEGFLQTRCSEPVPGREAECRALAEMLVAHSDSTRALALGLDVGQTAGWPRERVQVLQQELQALASDRARWQPEASQPLSCRSVDAWLQDLQQMAAMGELPALRQRLAEHRVPR